MNTQYRKNLKAVLEANKEYTDNKINEFAWFLGAYDLSVDSDNTTAYTKSVPSGVYSPDGTPKAVINSVGGMSYKINQLVENGNFESLSNWRSSNASKGTISISNNELNYTVITTGVSYDNGFKTSTIQPTNGHKYLIACQIKSTGNTTMGYDIYNVSNAGTGTSISLTNSYQQWNFILTVSNASPSIYFCTRANTTIGEIITIKNVNCIDLTAMGIDTTDVATATSELLKRGIDINIYNAYDTGSIRNSAITSITSKDSNNTTLETKTINASIQALNGYGWGINDTLYNYIDFENKKFIQKVGRVDLGTLNYEVYSADRRIYRGATVDNLKSDVPATDVPNFLSVKYTATTQSATWANGDIAIRGALDIGAVYICDTDYATAEAFKAAMNGVYLYYELGTPVETDISAYLDDDSIVVGANGTLTFDNTYNQAVPSSIDYLVKEVKA